MSFARCIAGAALGCVLLVTPLTHAADDSINEDARRHFNAGVSLLQDPDGARYEDAYREFEAAFAASLSPKILGNIGYCALKLERDSEAIAAYSRYLQEVRDVDPAEVAQITRDVATLRAGLVRLAIAIDARDASVIDKRLPSRGESITNLYAVVNGKLEIGVRPGHHVIDVKVHGQSVEPWELDAKPGAALSHKFFAKSPVETTHKTFSRPLPWVVTGLGAAGLAAGGVAGAITLGKVNAIANSCPANTCPTAYALKPAQDEARRFRTVTDALLIGGGVVTVAGVWLVFAMSGQEAERPPTGEVRAASTLPSVACSPSECLAAMTGTF